MIGADGYRRLVSTIRLDMLRLLGKPYIMEHIRAEVRRHQEAQLFRDYVASSPFTPGLHPGISPCCTPKKTPARRSRSPPTMQKLWQSCAEEVKRPEYL